MAVERKFVDEAVKKAKIERFIQKKLERVGCGDIDVKRTPLGTRVVIHTTKPGLVIGRKGKNIQMLTDALKTKFKIENPQLEVQEVQIPEYDPQLMAKQLASLLERGIHFRRAAYSMVQRIMDKGAMGAQITISGKISGSRARTEKFKAGFIKHCGKPAELYIKETTAQAFMKPGVLGINVKIAPPAELAEVLKLNEVLEKKAEETKEQEKEEEKPEEAKPKKEEKAKAEKKSEKKKPTTKPKKKAKTTAKKTAIKKSKSKKVKTSGSSKKK